MASQTLDACAEHKLPVADVQSDKWTERAQRAQWLRAAILGANDGLLSTTSLMLGVGAAKEDRWSMVLSGLAGAFAGACSMAVGEFASVSTQRDIEKANNCPKTKLRGGHNVDDGIKIDITAASNPSSINNAETKPAMSPAVLTCEPSERVVVSPAIMTPGRRLPPLAVNSSPGRPPMMKVITEDARKPEAEEEEAVVLPNPYKAAAASALAFLCGSFVPLVPAIFVVHHSIRIVVITVVTSIALALFGGMGAHLGGSPVRVSAVRLLAGGWIAMAITYGLLKPFDRDDRGHDSD